MEQNKKKILLIEDDTNLAKVYKARLETEGFEVFIMSDGEEAVATIAKFKPDLVLLDAMMPKISGFDVLQKIRSNPDTSNVVVVMLSALSQEKDKSRAKELGADEYLVKSEVVIGDVVEGIKHHLQIEGV